jgi:hypothetical protein
MDFLILDVNREDFFPSRRLSRLRILKEGTRPLRSRRLPFLDNLYRPFPIIELTSSALHTIIVIVQLS